MQLELVMAGVCRIRFLLLVWLFDVGNTVVAAYWKLTLIHGCCSMLSWQYCRGAASSCDAFCLSCPCDPSPLSFVVLAVLAAAVACCPCCFCVVVSHDEDKQHT